MVVVVVRRGGGVVVPWRVPLFLLGMGVVRSALVFGCAARWLFKGGAVVFVFDFAEETHLIWMYG